MESRQPPVSACPSCAGDVSGQFCPTCGFDQGAPQTNPWAEPDDTPVLSSPGPIAVPPRRHPSLLALLVGLTMLAVVGVLAMSWAGNGHLLSGAAPATTTSSSPAPATATSTTSSPVPTKEPTAQSTAPAGLPSGLLCADLRAQGLDYGQAVSYWVAEGQPDRMDADRNGIPCETRYPREDVVAYWGDEEWGAARDYLGNLPSGLYCRDLQSRGLDYGQAVAYWLSQDMPDRMDEDLDGIPCETVYGDEARAAYWSERG